jgi:hypothetical protein
VKLKAIMVAHNVVFVVAGAGCRVDDVGYVKCECVCEVESDPLFCG